MFNEYWKCSLAIVLVLLPMGCLMACPERTYERREHALDQMPYIVYIEMQSHDRLDLSPYTASGIIIDVNMVLTLAYHCETSYSQTMVVYAGQYYINPKNSPNYVQHYELHPDRDGETMDLVGGISNYKYNLEFNFCMLRLRHNLVWSPTIQRAPLPFNYEKIGLNEQLMVSGWGPFRDTGFIQGKCQAALGKAKYIRAGLFFSVSPRVESHLCKDSLRHAGFDALPNDVFCLGHPCKDYHTALGDDGGPVVHVDSGKVVGMVMNLRDNDEAEEYQTNADLRYAVDWINNLRPQWVNPPIPWKRWGNMFDRDRNMFYRK